MNKKIIIISTFVGIMVLSLMSIAAIYGTQKMSRLGGDLMGAQYRPSSEWVEPGLDPNVTTLGFEGNAPSGPPVSDRVVRQWVRDRNSDLMPCYVRGLEDWDDFAGRVDFEFGIATDGRLVLSRVLASELEDKSTEDCFVKRSRSWKFPGTERPGVLKVQADFNFSVE